MKTLEQLIQEEHNRGEIKLPKQEQDRINRVVSKLDDQRYKDVRSQSASDGWWDSNNGKYQFINRNIVSQIKRDTACYIVQALCKHLGPGIGVGGTPISGVKSVNTKECDIIVTDYRLPLEDDSIGYILSHHTLEHIPEDPDIVIKEWLRVLKLGGLIAITLPDDRYFKHENRSDISKYDWAYHEFTPTLFKSYLDKISDKAELLLFDTHENCFDFDVLLRKK